MRRVQLLVVLAFSLGSITACGTNVGGGNGGDPATGGSPGTGGSTGTAMGGDPNTGGSTGTAMGGDPATGGSPGTGGSVTTSTGTGTMPMMCDPNDPATGCPDGQGCICGGPGASITCTCGLICASDADCTNPAQPMCCGGGAGTTGICTDPCTCTCD